MDGQAIPNIRVATCNLLYDGNPPSPAGTWQQRKPHLIKLLNEKRPDVLATQEGWRPQLEDFDGDLEHLSLVNDHRTWTKKMFPCLFINPQRLRVVEAADRWLSETPLVPDSMSFGSQWPKLCTLALLEDRLATSQRFLVASFHFDNVTAKARPFQAQVLMSQANELARGHPMILMGDANEVPGDPAITEIQKKFTDIYGASDLPATHHGFGQNSARIDYIFCDSHCQVGERWTDDRQSNWYSDHWLITAELSFSSPG